MQTQSTPLVSTSIGTRREFVSFHFGTPGAGEKIYVQASLHADEIPAMLTAWRLKQRLIELENAGRIRGEVILVPVANPIGLSQHVLGQFLGRFELNSGHNFNRSFSLPAAAALIGFATLRLKSDFLAITTFGVSIVVHLVVLNAQSLTGGTFGIGFIPRPFASLAETPLYFNLSNLAVVAAVTLVVFFSLEHLAHSPWGRVLKALREDERAAISLGKSARFYRTQAFALGGGIMGLAGAVQAHFIGYIAPDNYLPTLTFQVWVMLVVGGSGSNLGAVIGSLIVWAIWAGSGAMTGMLFAPERQAHAASLQLVAIGVMLCIILLVRPNGIFGGALQFRDRRKKRNSVEKAGGAEPSPSGFNRE